MDTINVKEAASELVRQMPEDATWDDLMYRIYVRQSIEKGLADSDVGRKISVQQVKQMLELAV
jgi:hypothetical protein